MTKLILLTISIICGLATFAGESTRINVLNYKSLVKNPGAKNADWHPAFQKAIEDAWKSSRILYVPAGTYNISKTITIWKKPGAAFVGTAFKLVGDGRYVSTIRQTDPKQNCVDWTGKNYKGSVSAGTIQDICLVGGKITLNMKWHNQFTMRSCYIVGAKEIGIYSEGWSNRFLDIVVRHCPNIGFKGYSHFNDITIRDGYFSRCGVAIYLHGGRGVRISGIGIEQSHFGIYFGSITSAKVDSCYFECVGLRKVKKAMLKYGPPSNIVINQNTAGVSVENCIFRATRNCYFYLAGGTNITISQNVFQNSFNEAIAYFAPTSLSRKKTPTSFKNIIIKNNFVYENTKLRKTPVPYFYLAGNRELMDKAIKAGCKLYKQADKTKYGDLGKLDGKLQKTKMD